MRKYSVRDFLLKEGILSKVEMASRKINYSAVLIKSYKNLLQEYKDQHDRLYHAECKMWFFPRKLRNYFLDL